MARPADTATEQAPGEVESNELPQTDENGNVTTNEAAAPAEPAKPKTSIGVMISVPIGMKEVLDRVAAENNTTVAAWARVSLAKLVEYELPATATRKGRQTNKYEGMTEAQKKDAMQAEQSAKRQKASALLAALEAGDLDIDLDAILAKYKPATRAPRRASAEADATPAVEAASATS